MTRIPKGLAIKQGQINHVYEYSYSDLSQLKSDEKLIPKANYKITDYTTKHGFASDFETIHTSSVESIIITAISNDSFSPLAISETYPGHVITYDFDNDTCEDVAETP